MDVREHNRHAWNRQVERENSWTVPVSESDIVAGGGQRGPVLAAAGADARV